VAKIKTIKGVRKKKQNLHMASMAEACAVQQEKIACDSHGRRSNRNKIQPVWLSKHQKKQQ